MHLSLNRAQQTELTLISLYSGKPIAQVLVETAEYLVDRDLEFWHAVQHRGIQDTLHNDEMDARLSQLLGRQV